MSANDDASAERRAFLKGTLLAAGTATVVTSPRAFGGEPLAEAPEAAKAAATRVAEIGYSKESREIQLSVPYGTHLTDLSKVMEFLSRDVFWKLPRGCTACTSGDHLIIRERLENVILVDLDQRTILR